MIIKSWIEADVTTGTATIQFTDDMVFSAIVLRGYAVQGLNGSWPSTMKISIKGRNNVYVGQTLQANVTENKQISMVVPIGDAASAVWFDGPYPPMTTDIRSNATNALTFTVYEQNGTTVLTGTDIKLYFEIHHTSTS